MVKRTLIVLGMFGLILMASGPSMAFLSFPPAPCFGGELVGCKPMFLPVDCPEPPQRNIVKTWEIKIVGPCPAVSPPCGTGCGNGLLGRDDRVGLLTSLAQAVATPFDWIFAGLDGVYGCCPGGGGEAICGSTIPGPIPGAVTSFIGLFSGGATDGVFFGGLW